MCRKHATNRAGGNRLFISGFREGRLSYVVDGAWDRRRSCGGRNAPALVERPGVDAPGGGGRPGFARPLARSPWPVFGIAFAPAPRSLSRFVKTGEHTLNTELVTKALEKVGNPNTLVGIVSRRVRQLNAGGGGGNRPLIENAGSLGAADIALREVIEDKIGWDMPELDTAPLEAKRQRRRK